MNRISRMFLLILFIVGCDPADNRLTIANNSNTNIYYIITCDSTIHNSNIIENQTFIGESNDTVFVESDNFIAMKSSKKVVKVGKNGWEKFIKFNCSHEQIYLTFILDSIVNNYSVENILDQKLYLKQVSITLGDLKNNDWIVNFDTK